MNEPEVIWLLDRIRTAVSEMDSENEDSIDQIPALRKIVRASVDALAQLETRKDLWVLETLQNAPTMAGYAWDYQRSQQIEEKS